MFTPRKLKLVLLAGNFVLELSRSKEEKKINIRCNKIYCCLEALNNPWIRMLSVVTYPWTYESISYSYTVPSTLIILYLKICLAYFLCGEDISLCIILKKLHILAKTVEVQKKKRYYDPDMIMLIRQLFTNVHFLNLYFGTATASGGF